jgi:MOSC domain-containing protein YiiM
MKLVQISVGTPHDIEFDGKTTKTGIFKIPVDGPVFADELHLEGDGQADLSVHGGRDKAVYLYSEDYYPLWAAELGRKLEAAQFGENLTVSGCRDEDIVLGTRLRIGAVELRVMQPRIPCFKLGIRMGDAEFPGRFWAAGRLGVYLRVEKTGVLQHGDAIEIIATPAHGITARALWEAVNQQRREAALRAAEALPELDAGWQKRLRLASRA